LFDFYFFGRKWLINLNKGSFLRPLLRQDELEYEPSLVDVEKNYNHAYSNPRK